MLVLWLCIHTYYISLSAATQSSRIEITASSNSGMPRYVYVCVLNTFPRTLLLHQCGYPSYALTEDTWVSFTLITPYVLTADSMWIPERNNFPCEPALQYTETVLLSLDPSLIDRAPRTRSQPFIRMSYAAHFLECERLRSFDAHSEWNLNIFICGLFL